MAAIKRNALASGLAMAAALALTGGSPAMAQTNQNLKVVSIDVEGGAATLFVTPQGHSLLIDAGWVAGAGGPRPAPGAPPPPPTPSSAQRIVTVMKSLGLTKLDYFMVSHYHPDHVGGAAELIGLIPIGTLIDHGAPAPTPPPAPRPADAPPPPPPPANPPPSPTQAYLALANSGRPHLVMQPGQTLKIDDLDIVVSNSAKKLIDKPLQPGARPVAECGALTSKTNVGGEENPWSVGLVATYGRSRILALADTTWDVEQQLVCPTNLIGQVDLMMADNHGSDLSNPPALLQSVKPQVMIVNNGPTKGAEAPVLDRLKTVDGMAVWQVHYGINVGDKNAAADQIANLQGDDAMHPLIASIDKNGGVTMTNPRNGFTKTYRRAR